MERLLIICAAKLRYFVHSLLYLTHGRSLCWFFVPTTSHERFKRFWTSLHGIRARSLMNSPHYTKSRSPDFVEWLPPGQHFPKDNSKAKDITLLRVCITFEYFGCHPGGTSFAIAHVSVDITSGSKITYLESATIIDQEQAKERDEKIKRYSSIIDWYTILQITS